MRTLIVLSLLLGLAGGNAEAAKSKKDKKQPAKTSKTQKGLSKKSLDSMGAKLGTDFRMDGLNVGGRYQSASVGLSTIENEKPLHDLLDYDVDFKSRSQVARGWK